jgi:hypothetical protein
LPEIVADLKANYPDAVMDENLATLIQAGIDAMRVPWYPPSWDDGEAEPPEGS